MLEPLPSQSRHRRIRTYLNPNLLVALSHRTMSRTWSLTTKDVETLLFKGYQIVIHDGHVLKLDGWMNDHPGGKLVILHMVGRDATNEINM